MEKFQIGIVLFIQILIILFFGLFVEYHLTPDNSVKVYPAFQDVHVMIFIGFGFLMVFLKHHSFTSVGYNMFVAAWAIQVCILFRGMWQQAFDDEADEKIHLDLYHMAEADFGAGAVLISFGAVLGKLNAFQLLIMAVLELFFYALNQAIAVWGLEITDIGGSINVHMFGGFFGIALTMAFSSKDCTQSKFLKDGTISNLVAMVGTVFLWMFWPSFNGLLATGEAQEQVFMNTVLALTASCVIVFLLSAGINKGKFKMEDILNATLAGGVIMGTSADLCDNPCVALIIGFCGGLISVLGYNFLTPKLGEKIGFHDTCGVTNLHGIPGMFGGIVGSIVTAAMDENKYNKTFAAISENRKQSDQAGYQFLMVLVAMGISLSSGFLVGKILRINAIFKGPTNKDDLFNDNIHFHPAEDAEEEEKLFAEIKDEIKQTKQGVTTLQHVGSQPNSPNQLISRSKIQKYVDERYNELLQTEGNRDVEELPNPKITYPNNNQVHQMNTHSNIHTQGQINTQGDVLIEMKDENNQQQQE